MWVDAGKYVYDFSWGNVSFLKPRIYVVRLRICRLECHKTVIPNVEIGFQKACLGVDEMNEETLCGHITDKITTHSVYRLLQPALWSHANALWHLRNTVQVGKQACGLMELWPST